MPRKPPTPCCEPGCPNLTHERYCAVHSKEAKRAAEKLRDRHGRMTGQAWVERRAAYLRRHPLCRACEADGRVKAAEEVDHIVPLADGGAEAWDNYQPLCKACHRAKSRVEHQARYHEGQGPATG